MKKVAKAIFFLFSIGKNEKKYIKIYSALELGKSIADKIKNLFTNKKEA